MFSAVRGFFPRRAFFVFSAAFLSASLCGVSALAHYYGLNVSASLKKIKASAAKLAAAKPVANLASPRTTKQTDEIQFDSASYTVEENGLMATITVSRANGTNSAVTVDYATSDGTATAGSDYVTTSGTLTFIEGETSQTFMVPINTDFDPEVNETVNLTLTNPTNGAVLGTPDSATLTINNFGGDCLQFSSATYSVSENSGSATITVTRLGGTPGTITVNYATSDGTATAGSDYTAASGTLTFNDGDASKTFSVPVLSDFLTEGNETINLTLSSPMGAGAGLCPPNPAVLTITNVPAPGQLQFSSATYSVAENGGSATITVTRTNGSEGSVTVDYATSDGTATAGSDYTAASGTLTFGDGETSKTFSVPVQTDAITESDETVNLTLTAPPPVRPGATTDGTPTLGTPSAAVLTITNVAAPGQLQFSSATYSVAENGGSATITVTRTNGSEGTVSVDYATSDGTATAGSDYTAASGTLTFGDGETSKSFAVPVQTDFVAESDETVNLTLSNPSYPTRPKGATSSGPTLGTPNTAVLMIYNIPAPGQLQFSSATYSASELDSTATITVTRTNGSEGIVTVDYATSNGTATAGSDYTAASGTLSFADGETSKTFTVPILPDQLAEPDETVNLTLSNPSGGSPCKLSDTLGCRPGVGGPTLGTPSTAVLTIYNVPMPGQLQFSSATYNVNETGGAATITVTRTNGSEGSVTVDYATSNGTATAGSDYTATSGTLNFADGETSKTFSVPVLTDLLVDPNETVNLTLSNPQGGSCGKTKTSVCRPNIPYPVATLGTPSTAVLTIADSPQADLAITKTNGVTSLTRGGSAIYTITASNNGPHPVTGATVTDTFPATLTGCTWTCTGAGGGTCTASGSGSISDSANLPAGAAVTYTATCTVATSATGTISNTATVSSSLPDANSANNSATDADPVACQTITVTNPTVNAAVKGVAFSQTFTQTGGVGATTFSTVSTLPSGLTLSSAGVLSGTPTQTGSFPIVVKATDSNDCMGTGATYTLAVNPFSVQISDPLICNGPGGVLDVLATVTNASANAQTIAFSAAPSVANQLFVLNGSCTATGQASGSCSTPSSAQVTFNGQLAAGQTLTIRYRVQVADSIPQGTSVCMTSVASIDGGPNASVTACGAVNCPAAGPGLLPSALSAVESQKAGSVLFYNFYTSSVDAARQNTRFSLTNTNPAQTAYVHLFFVDGNTCSIADSYICLTPNQTSSFLASDLDPGTSGYVVAVATDSAGCPINFNYLIGDEFVKLASGHAANLNAEAISALAGGLTACNPQTSSVALAFDGTSYNTLPRVLALSNIGSRADSNDTLLVINRVGGNLATGAATVSSLFGLLYNDAETAYSFTLAGSACQLRGSLSANFPRTTPRFETVIPAGRTGWLKLWSASDNAILGAALNFNSNAATNAGAFTQGHNLHKLTFTNTATLTIPVFPPTC